MCTEFFILFETGTGTLKIKTSTVPLSVSCLIEKMAQLIDISVYVIYTVIFYVIMLCWQIKLKVNN